MPRQTVPPRPIAPTAQCGSNPITANSWLLPACERRLVRRARVVKHDMVTAVTYAQ